MSETTFYHTAVLLHECIDQLQIQPSGVYLDATFGGGGHSKEILKQLGPEGKLIVFDQDKDARRNLPEDSRVLFVPENFRYAARFVRLYKLGQLNGVLADLGVSSFQFDTAEKGFSIRFDAPLDMRMDQRNPITAEEIVNTYSEKQLQDVFEQYGEVTNAKTLAKRIVDVRGAMKINSIQEFKQAISTCVYGNPNKYLAQVFQALRIEVNQELNVLKEFLETITPCLAPKGRLCVITFHSLEDRIVKNWMKNERFEEENHYLVYSKVEKRLTVKSKKPILPSDQELKQNSRSRSAKLRVAERTEK
jgi:16S rRNA (cytosine1402-N4)-methyltransferase